MVLDILKGFLIGICASAPLGPVAIFVMQKTLKDGRRAGFLTGLGATSIDTFWASVAIFALALVQGFIDSHEKLILVAGGAVISVVGVMMTLRDPFRRLNQDKDMGFSLADFFRCVALALSNPGAIAVMFTLFAFFGIEAEESGFMVAPVILSVSAGSMTYWFFFTKLFSSLRKKINMTSLVWMNRGFGVLVSIIGLALFVQGVMQWLFGTGIHAGAHLIGLLGLG